MVCESVSFQKGCVLYMQKNITFKINQNYSNTMFGNIFKTFISWLHDVVLYLVKFVWLTPEQRLTRLTSTQKESAGKIIPESVNFHFTRQCNYQCKFI